MITYFIAGTILFALAGLIIYIGHLEDKEYDKEEQNVVRLKQRALEKATDDALANYKKVLAQYEELKGKNEK
jgi:hypothetical protein